MASATANATAGGQCGAPTILTTGNIIGLTITSQSGLISALAILVLSVLIARNIFVSRRSGVYGTHVVSSHLEVYLLSLLLSELLQALGGIMDLRWVHQRSVTCGHYCSAQGAIQSLGEPTVAMATLAITLHTFCVIFFNWTPSTSLLTPVLIVTVMWLYAILYVSISFGLHHNPASSYFTPTPYWCWVSSRYPNERITEEYLWLWTTAGVSILTYIPLAFVIRGSLVVDSKKPWKWRWRGSRELEGARAGQMPTSQSLKMLLYPATYITIILPLVVSRWIEFNPKDHIASTWTFVGVSIYGLSGLANVLLLTITRPSLLTFGVSSRLQILHERHQPESESPTSWRPQGKVHEVELALDIAPGQPAEAAEPSKLSTTCPDQLDD